MTGLNAQSLIEMLAFSENMTTFAASVVHLATDVFNTGGWQACWPPIFTQSLPYVCRSTQAQNDNTLTGRRIADKSTKISYFRGDTPQTATYRVFYAGGAIEPRNRAQYCGRLPLIVCRMFARIN